MSLKLPCLKNGNPEEILLFVCNLNMTLAASGTLDTALKVKYLNTLVRGEELRQFYLMYTDV